MGQPKRKDPSCQLAAPKVLGVTLRLSKPLAQSVLVGTRGGGAGPAAQTGPPLRSALGCRRAYRRGWKRTVSSHRLDEKQVLMAGSCIQSSLLLFKELPKWSPENEQGRESQLQQKKPMSGRAEENKVYFSGIS